MHHLIDEALIQEDLPVLEGVSRSNPLQSGGCAL